MLLIAFFTIVTNATWLPCLIKSLEIEEIVTPAKCSADAFLEENLGVFIRSYRGAVLGATLGNRLARRVEG
jgi:hypothetical protein